MLSRGGGSWVGASSAGAIANGRWWFYQDFSAGSGPGLTLTGNSNGSGGSLSFSTANIVNSSAVVTDTDGNPVFSSTTEIPANLVRVTAHTAGSVTLNAAPDSSFGSVRIWYLYTASTGSLPENMEVAPDFVKYTRAEWLDGNFLNQNLNLSDLPNASTARTNLGFSAITAGRILLGDGGTLPSSDSNLFFDTTNDFLGVGTVVPARRIHQDGGNATATYHKFTAGTTTGVTATDGLDVGVDGSGNAEIIQRENLPLIIYTNATEVARFLSTGELLLKQNLQLEDSDGGTNKISIAVPNAIASDYTLTLPVDGGTVGYVLRTDGSGTTTWVSPTTVSGLTTKGDLLSHDGSSVGRLAVGANFGAPLVVDSSQTFGIKWGQPTRAGIASVASGATTKAITFNNMPDALYGISAVWKNTVDILCMRQPFTIISQTVAGFTLEWDNQLDTANYEISWVVHGAQA